MRSETPLRPNYLDASALVKLVVREEHSTRVRSYVFEPSHSWRICTSYCFIEGMTVLKTKWRKSELSERAYIAKSRQLVRLVKDETICMVQSDFPGRSSFPEAERMVKSHGIDLLDAFQLISVRDSWEQLAKASKPLLITADRDLARAAIQEGLLSWYCRETHEPTC